jgi:hypothetical protein
MTRMPAALRVLNAAVIGLFDSSFDAGAIIVVFFNGS